MIDGESVLAVIPARGGSKGLPRKNLLPLGGAPLIVHSIRQALDSELVDRVICSTDDPEIAAIANEHGCETPFMRPEELATDAAASIDVLRHVCSEVSRHDYLVLLQPTSPLRNVSDIEACIRLCQRRSAPTVATVCEVDKSPAWMFTLDDETMLPLLPEGLTATRRQDLSSIYSLNGAVYTIRWQEVVQGHALIGPNTLAHIMPKWRSVDIDTDIDLRLAELLLRNQRARSETFRRD